MWSWSPKQLARRSAATSSLDAADLRAALDPWSFVEQRTIPGGPAPSAMQSHLAQMHQRLAADVAWREARQAQIEAARIERQRRAAALEKSTGHAAPPSRAGWRCT